MEARLLVCIVLCVFVCFCVLFCVLFCVGCFVCVVLCGLFCVGCFSAYPPPPVPFSDQVEQRVGSLDIVFMQDVSLVTVSVAV
jgi:hypothetical protein